jgi:hypothetical protein
MINRALKMTQIYKIIKKVKAGNQKGFNMKRQVGNLVLSTKTIHVVL